MFMWSVIDLGTRHSVGNNVVKSVSERGRGGPVSMTMVVFVASWGLLGPQGLWTVILHRNGKAAEGLYAGDRMPCDSFLVLSTCSRNHSSWTCALSDAARGAEPWQEAGPVLLTVHAHFTYCSQRPSGISVTPFYRRGNCQAGQGWQK